MSELEPSSSKGAYDTVLVLTALRPASLMDDLKANFKNIIYRPDRTASDEDFAQADVIITFLLPPNLKNISQTPNLKFFQGTSAGYAHLPPSDFFKSIPEDRQITWAHASGIHITTIGEHVIASILILWHKLHHLILRMRAEKTWINVFTDPGFGTGFIKDLRNKTVGIVGYGHIGREAGRLAHAFGAHILAMNRSGKKASIGGYLRPGTGDEEGELPIGWYSTNDAASVKEFASKCDVVVVTLPSAPENKKFINEEFFKAMKGDALFVNIGRGDTVDQEKLVEALQAKPAEGELLGATGSLRIGGASLDVTEPEPLPDNHPLYTMENVMLTPHMSGLADTYVTYCIDILCQNVQRLRAGDKGLNVWKGKGL
ncbi:D-isomer specific 2-hydroxyacid dehydrogenase [Pseudohyphozyma bogoriensis]|nr:D-isomer specific 2-hydroxyacid dehydrogenase [Pseudohyphozyma bogoriensis]